ncbi:MAG: Tex family protein [Acholeplasmatales bacterium]|jgi:S1 RNA binding domain protein|nr:RNA-binding transcriptional accessory protein [Acholeplasmatales bacterium]MDD7395510.1 Tex family protein [Acholeplasmatales bacterium]MDY4016682.1 Tex family protein [Bacilli bacterium]
MENNYINDALLGKISREQNVRIGQIRAVLELIEGGATVPFIARYRKEVTGNLDEEQIRAIYQEWDYGQKLAARKEDVMRLIEEKGKLTDEIKMGIINATKLSEIEDIYRPFKEKKKTRATDAKKKGLEPLAEYLLSFPLEGNVEEEASKYVTNLEGKTPEEIEAMKKEGVIVKNTAEAIQGAKDIIAEMVSDEPKFRAWIRENFENEAKMKSEVKEDAVDEKKVYEMYYNYEEPLKTIKLHRILALNRAEDEKVVKVSIVEDYAKVLDHITGEIVKAQDSITAPYVKEAAQDGYDRLIKPAIVREIRGELKDKAEDQAINIFGENLKNYLLQPPMKGKVVLGVDPAFRTGCKLAVVDATGKLLEKSVMYPHQKQKGEVVPPARYQAAVDTFCDLINRHNVEVVAMGNGTASRETEAFVAKTLKSIDRDVKYIIVNEAGASVYSASDLAREEFPDFSVEERSAISIARRLQDPLSELVKIDPKSIGVGQYQHDVSQSKLADSLDFVVETAVNQVGVNINTASYSLLKYVAGLNAGTAKKIVAHREENGRFENRNDIKVKGVGPKALEQAMGFLRIVDGNEPLDMTAIHPESYEIARAILTKLGFTSKDLGSTELVEKIKGLTEEEKKAMIEELNVGEYTFQDILDAFVSPLRDPRDMIEAPVLRGDILELKDLSAGMELQGTVRNVTDFGAFVDCGLHDDGLVHVSKMSTKFIKHPLEAVHVGQIVKVWVLDVDLAKGRLQLTMIDPNAPKPEPQPKKQNNKNNVRRPKPQVDPEAEKLRKERQEQRAKREEYRRRQEERFEKQMEALKNKFGNN